MSSQAVGELLKGKIKVVYGDLALQGQQMESLHEAERCAGRRVLKCGRIELVSKELLNASAGGMKIATFTELDGDGVEAVSVHDNEAPRTNGRRGTTLTRSVTQLQHESHVLESGWLKESAIPFLRSVSVPVC